MDWLALWVGGPFTGQLVDLTTDCLVGCFDDSLSCTFVRWSVSRSVGQSVGRLAGWLVWV